MTSVGDSRVSIPRNSRKVIQEIKKTLLGSNHTDDFVYATLKDSSMNPNEAGRRLKMIHDIREIAGKHSVEDVYTMLKDCNMDPNEAAQRLLYIDTFHEVKKKQDRHKSISSDTSEKYKQTRGNQWRGANGRQGTFRPSKAFDDAGGGRSQSSGKEYGGTNRLERVLRPALPALSRKDNTIHVTNYEANVKGTPAISNGSYLHKFAPKLLPVRPPDVSSSTPDSVVVSSQNTRYTCSVGTIKCEIIKRSGCIESNSKIPAGRKFSADQVIIPVIAESTDSDIKMQLKSVAVEEIQPLKVTVSEHMTVSTTNTHSVPEKESEVKLSAPKLDVHSVPEEEPELKLSAPKVDLMLEKLTISSHGSVIFPDHIQVPENLKTQFTFGSLEAGPDDFKPLSVTESPQQNGEIATEPSLRNGNVSATAQEVEFKDHLAQLSENEPNSEIVAEPYLSNENDSSTAQEGEFNDDSLPHLSEHEMPSQDDNVSSDAALKHEEGKLETMPLTGGFQNPYIQTTRNYHYGLMPNMMGPHFVQLDTPELQNGSPLTASAMGPTTTTQPGLPGQSSIAFSPPLYPYFRQPYPNYIPYNPYYPHMYFQQNAHFMNHGVFPQQRPTTMVKFPAPSQNIREP